MARGRLEYGRNALAVGDASMVAIELVASRRQGDWRGMEYTIGEVVIDVHRMWLGYLEKQVS